MAIETAVLIFFLPGMARRLHDVGLSLWTLTLVWGIYAAVLAVQATGMFGDRRRLIILLSNIPLLLLILSLFVIRGAKGPNRFGADPTTDVRDG